MRSNSIPSRQLAMLHCQASTWQCWRSRRLSARCSGPTGCCGWLSQGPAAVGSWRLQPPGPCCRTCPAPAVQMLHTKMHESVQVHQHPNDLMTNDMQEQAEAAGSPRLLLACSLLPYVPCTRKHASQISAHAVHCVGSRITGTGTGDWLMVTNPHPSHAISSAGMQCKARCSRRASRAGVRVLGAALDVSTGTSSTSAVHSRHRQMCRRKIAAAGPHVQELACLAGHWVVHLT